MIALDGLVDDGKGIDVGEWAVESCGEFEQLTDRGIGFRIEPRLW